MEKLTSDMVIKNRRLSGAAARTGRVKEMKIKKIIKRWVVGFCKRTKQTEHKK